MGSYLKISPIRQGKFNNAEYTNFMNRTLNQAVAVGIEKIGANEALIDNITANVNKMTDIVAQSRASVETAQIAEVDKKADELIVYLMATFRTNRTSPIQAMRTAAETLYLKRNLTWDARHFHKASKFRRCVVCCQTLQVQKCLPIYRLLVCRLSWKN